MNKKLCGLILIGALLIFAIVGYLIPFLFNKKKRLKKCDFILQILFFVILINIIIYIFPLIYECLDFRHFYLFLIFLVVGFILMKIVDNYLPYHDDNKLLKKELKDNYWHISVITTISVVLYNILLGADVYTMTLTSVNLGVDSTISTIIRMTLFSFILSFLMNQESISKVKRIVLSLVFFLSIIGGGVLGFILNGSFNAKIFGCLFSLVFGMFAYILLNELWVKVKKTKNKRLTILTGILVFIVLLIGLFI